MDEERQKELQKGPGSHLPFGGGELVRIAARIIEARNWGTVSGHRGAGASARSTGCMAVLNSRRGTRGAWFFLIGDAAYPTSPVHLRASPTDGLKQMLTEPYIQWLSTSARAWTQP